MKKKLGLRLIFLTGFILSMELQAGGLWFYETGAPVVGLSAAG